MAKRAKQSSPIGTVLTYAYGTATIAAFEGARRIDTYRPFEVSPREPWNAAIRESSMCLDHNDASPVAQTYAYQCGSREPFARAYNARCSCCYLNISHTTALHDARIADAPEYSA